MTEAVDTAAAQIREAFHEHRTDVQDDGQGGAWVLVEDVDVGALYVPQTTWVGFRITFQYPYADVYPHYVRSDLMRRDGRVWGDGISGGHNFMGRSALQLSRRSNRLNPATDTALLKMMKVIQWLSTHP